MPRSLVCADWALSPSAITSGPGGTSVRPARLALAALLVGACHGADAVAPAAADAARTVSVSFATGATTGLLASTSRAPGLHADAGPAASPDTSALVLTRVQLVVKRTTLIRSDSATCGTRADGDDDAHGDTPGAHEDHDASDDNACQAVRLGPAVVDLPVDASVATPIAAAVPAGTYRKLNFAIHAVRATDADSAARAFLGANPDLAGVAVRVTGTYRGQAFVFRSDASATVETRFAPPVTVGGSTGTAGAVNVTVHAAPKAWFVAKSGSVIDPTAATAGSASARQITQNIKASFRAFRDDDRHNHDDGAGPHS